jgi:hypothetical protein
MAQNAAPQMTERAEVKSQVQQPVEQGDACCATQAEQPRLRPWLIGGALLAAALALYAGWHWLVAVGLATTVLALAPCLAMCALGLCMGRGKKP